MTAVIKRDQQNVGEAHSSGFLVLGKTCKDEPYLCKLTIHPSAFIAWTNLCLPLQELKPSEPVSVFVVLQQAWPGGTQQILLPSTWQQLPGVALHNSVQPAAVIPETIGSSQQLADWR